MSNFPYLGCTILFNNRDWAAIYQNLRKSHRNWGMVLGLMVKAGGKVWSREFFYKAVVQALLI